MFAQILCATAQSTCLRAELHPAWIRVGLPEPHTTLLLILLLSLSF